MYAADETWSLLLVAATDRQAAEIRDALGSPEEIPVLQHAVTVEALEARLGAENYDAVLLCIDGDRSPGPARIRQLCEGRVVPPIIAISRNPDGPRADTARSEGVEDLLALDELGPQRLESSLRSAIALHAACRAADNAQQRWRRLYDNVPAGLFELDVRGRLASLNPATLELLGDDDIHALRKRLSDDAVFTDRRHRLEWLRAIAAAKTIHRQELALRHASGSIVHVIGACAPVRDERGILNGFEGMLTDVTRMKALQKQFVLAQKMEAVGQMTGGIAHDFNNVLTIIQGNLYLMEQELGGDHPVATILASTRSAARKGADLTRRLLAFARQDLLEPELVDLNERLESLRPLLERTVDQSVDLVIRGSATPAMVRVDPVQMESAVLNLVINARDAMPGGGVCTIRVDRGGRDGDAAGLTDRWCRITVSDTGQGFAPEARDRLFEPFFTTKPEGTGLGLTMVQAFVSGAGGSLAVESEPGSGTTFRLLLPASPR